ncbi:MAG: HAD-IIIC family phosphatase [Deferribacteraceae bacterium]|jgi:FkbH-like protein|nr:HAD-IIIC family phosphatase [Deferribacteraceae bacterium]
MAYSIKIALLSNYTVDYLRRPLEKELVGIENRIYLSGFNQVSQEILNPQSNLYRFAPNLILLMLQPSSLPITDLIRTLCSQTDAIVVVNNFYIPFQRKIHKTHRDDPNAALYALSQEIDNLYIFDYNGFIGYHGYSNVFDSKMYYLTKMHESRPYITLLAREYMRYVYGVLGCQKKCLVLDLDNTLWGGVIGEDGIEGIKLDLDGEGRAYYDFQSALLNLYNQGILLTVCSKNNEEDALNAIEKHPHMVLRKEHFACIIANWNDKASNIQTIAQRLNLGLDSFVFVDDNPFERNLVKELLPEVAVIDLPEDAALYTRTLNDQYYFAKLKITQDDLIRNKQYAENAIREWEAAKFTNLDDYLKSLDMELTIEKPNDFTMVRVHQLINKTNQFNMTTRRYTLDEVKAFDNILHFSLKDKFGDNGVVGVVILKFNDELCEIDTFLMSCRVLGRRVETAILNHIVSICKKRGVKTLKAEYLPTQKNAAYANIYPDYGFDNFTLQVDSFKAHDIDIFKAVHTNG